MSTIDTTTPMPNATGTETQPVPMVEVKALAEKILGSHCACHAEFEPTAFSRSEVDKVAELIADFIGLHPAPATLADETRRAENERLRAERDAIRDSLIETQAAQRGLDIRVQETADEFIRLKRDRDRAESEAEEYRGQAEAAEAKLAALSQPAPVVEDGTAREGEDERFARLWQAEQESNPNPIPDPNKRYASESERWAEGAAWNERHNARVRKVREAARTPAPAVPDGRTEEVERETPEELWDILINKDDRNSPEEYPEMALITFEEFVDFCSRAALSERRT